MMIEIDNIQVFIATHNRADLLPESLESLLNQTIKPKEIIVLDNESEDNTQSVVSRYKNQNVKYVQTYGFLGNFNMFVQLANKKYCMLFHDDDLLHYKYFEFVLKTLNLYPDLSLITTRYIQFSGFPPKMRDSVSPDVFLFENKKEFAEFLYYKEIVAYAPAIYRTEYLKKCNLKYSLFNKFNDWPLMVDVSGFGRSAVFLIIIFF